MTVPPALIAQAGFLVTDAAVGTSHEIETDGLRYGSEFVRSR